MIGAFRNTEKRWIDARRGMRNPCSFQVNYSVKNWVYMDYIGDLSTSGVFIKTSNKFSIGEFIIMSISLPNNSKPLKSKGQIVRITYEGIGVEFRKTQ